jgi:hypothetical protein
MVLEHAGLVSFRRAVVSHSCGPICLSTGLGPPVGRVSGGLGDGVAEAVAGPGLARVPAFPPWTVRDGNAWCGMTRSAVAICAAAPLPSKATASSGVIPLNPQTPLKFTWTEPSLPVSGHLIHRFSSTCPGLWYGPAPRNSADGTRQISASSLHPFYLLLIVRIICLLVHLYMVP